MYNVLEFTAPKCNSKHACLIGNGNGNLLIFTCHRA